MLAYEVRVTLEPLWYRVLKFCVGIDLYQMFSFYYNFFCNYHMAATLNLYLCCLLVVMELCIWNFVQRKIMNSY